MDIMTLKWRRTPHDHGVKALSHFGIVRLANDRHGNYRFMCLCCGEIWTVPAAKRLKTRYWLCPGGCNMVFWLGVNGTLSGALGEIWQIHDLCKQYDDGSLIDLAVELSEMSKGETPLRYLLKTIDGNKIECSWEENLNGILALVEAQEEKHHNTVFPKPVFNFIRHKVANLWRWFWFKEQSQPKGKQLPVRDIFAEIKAARAEQPTQ